MKKTKTTTTAATTATTGKGCKPGAANRCQQTGACAKVLPRFYALGGKGGAGSKVVPFCTVCKKPVDAHICDRGEWLG